MPYRNKEEYVYLDLELPMSTEKMAAVLYAGIETNAAFTILYNLYRGEFTRKQNSRNKAYIKVHIHPAEVETFNKLCALNLKKPISITLNYGTSTIIRRN